MKAVTGNPDDLSDDDLHKKAWPLVEPILAQRQQDAISRWHNAAHTDLAQTSLEKIVVAAHDGQIDTLLIAPGRQQWGTYEPDKRKVTTADEGDAENYDLLDFAAVRTLRTDGKVVLVDDSDQLGETGVAAICRFAMN